MSAKTKKTLMFVIPAVIGGVVIYLLNRKKKPVLEGGAGDSSTPGSGSKGSQVGYVFPLKKGSRGDKVKDLQRYMAMPASEIDGIFGDRTEARLVEVAGVKTVKSQQELDTIRQVVAGLQTSDRAKDLVTKFKAGGVSMYTIQAVVADEVVVDVYGAVQNTGATLSLPSGKTYSNKDYVLVGSTKLGKVIFEVKGGSNKGTYAADANKISLK